MLWKFWENNGNVFRKLFSVYSLAVEEDEEDLHKNEEDEQI